MSKGKEEKSFRDKLSTVDESGNRKWIYPKKPKGKYYDYRTYVSWVLLGFLFAGPFVKIGGEPMVMFNIVTRKFVFFGSVFGPQDFYLFGLLMITMVVFIILFTVIFGRLFCGWVCPQTIFMEMVFRKIEYAIEGDANKQRKLNKAPWTTNKIVKKTLKHIIFFSIALLMANLFLSYIISWQEVYKIMTEPIGNHVGGFGAMLIFSGLFYGVFAFFREQVCTNVCPYGRMQGVMLDEQTIVVAYDFMRGEPRGRKSRKTEVGGQALGDCVDCGLCVQVCPTGIDIRNGTQLECVNCTACMDACDEVMIKLKREPKLIRYDSHKGIETQERNIFNKRTKAYSAVLIGLLILNAILFFMRSDVEAILLRTPGTLALDYGENKMSNSYNFELINKTKNTFPITFDVVGKYDDAEIKLIGVQELIVQPNEVLKGVLWIIIDKDKVGRKQILDIEVFSNGVLIDKTKTSFSGPSKY